MKFTVGIPAYKAAYLKECIDSILAQTCTDFELVIVNDASPEDIDVIVDAYGGDYIRYYKNEKNFGAINVVDNWNKCLSYAHGEYFILMGDDDKMCPDYLEEFSTLIEKYPECDVYHCRTIVIDSESVPIGLTESRPEFESVYDSILQRMNGRHFFISDFVYKTNTLKSNRGFYKLPFAWASDDISSFIAAEKYGIAHTNKPVFMYRQNSQTISNTGDIYVKMEAIFEEEKWYKTFFLDRNPPNDIDKLLKGIIKTEITKYIQKKKIYTIYSSPNNIASFLKLYSLRKKYKLSSDEILYGFLMWIREKKKKRYKI